MLILNSIWSIVLIVIGFIGAIYLHIHAKDVFNWFEDKFTNWKF